MNEEILRIHYAMVKNDWDLLQKYLEFKGNPKYILIGDIDLEDREDISELKNLKKVVGNINLSFTTIQSFGDLEFVDGSLDLYGCENIKTLGNLKKVEKSLRLNHSSIESLGNLEFVGGYLWIVGTNIPPSELKKVNIAGKKYK